MQTAGRGSNEREDHGVDNVVKFPRDWIGPPEALVPFGPAADRDEPDRNVAFGPDAFWTEDAASLHEAIEAPLEPGDHIAAPEPSLPPLDGGRQRWRPVGLRRLGLVWVAVGLCLVVVAIVAMQDHHSGAARLAASVGQVKLAGNAEAYGGSVLSARAVRRLIIRGLDARSEHAARRRAHLASGYAHHVMRSVVRKTSAPAPPTEVSYSPSPALTGAGGSTSSTTPVASGSSQGTAATAATDSSSGSTSSSSGPVGAGAPFGPGQMGSGEG